MSQECFTLELPALPGRRLRVVFQRTNDRYGQAIELVDGPSIVRLLSSIEGSPSDDWPPSPPLQQLHIETRNDMPVALLVGMAGRNHWSMSVEFSASAPGIFFDVACRLGSPLVRLGSTYRLESTDSLPLEMGERVCRHRLQKWELNVLTAGQTHEGRIEHNGDELVIVPSSGGAGTVRWKYRVGWSGEQECGDQQLS